MLKLIQLKTYISKYKSVVYFGVFTVISLFFYFWFIKTQTFQILIVHAQQRFWTYFLFLVVFKMVAIVWPPIPGGLVTLGAIPLIGWVPAYIADSLGGLLGSSMAYFIGRHYGPKMMQHMLNDEVLKKVHEVKIVKGKEFEAIAVLKIFYGSISEIISYSASLLKINFTQFFLGSCVATLFNMPYFYIAHNVINFKGFYISIVFAVLALLMVFKIRGRYFE